MCWSSGVLIFWCPEDVRGKVHNQITIHAPYSSAMADNCRPWCPGLLLCFFATLLLCYVATLLRCYVVPLLHCYLLRPQSQEHLLRGQPRQHLLQRQQQHPVTTTTTAGFTRTTTTTPFTTTPTTTPLTISCSHSLSRPRAGTYEKRILQSAKHT